jgi:hypothetical protein
MAGSRFDAARSDRRDDFCKLRKFGPMKYTNDSYGATG